MDVGAQARRLSLPRTLPPSTPAPTPYVAGTALTPARRSRRHWRCTALARDSARSSQTLEVAATGTRACPELPTPEPSAVSTEHPHASKPMPRQRPELSATAALLSLSLSLSLLSPSARRLGRGRKPVNGRSHLGTGTLSHPVRTAIGEQRHCYLQAGHACSPHEHKSSQ